MKELVCYLLARLGGNEHPSKEDIVAILDSVGIKPDTAKLDSFFNDIDKLPVPVNVAINNGMAKLAVIPSGGSGGGASGTTDADETGGVVGTAPVDDDESSSSSSSSKAVNDLFGGGGGDDSSDDSDSESDSSEK